ncbi:MAG TPA: YfhO family protein [Chitinophagaceae bacterium]|nr:YfhO family protein [Chitinophagaceae bacterium]
MKLISEKHPVLACFLLVLIAYLPVVSFQFAIKNDFFSAYFPLKYFLSESIQSGLFPLWNPFLNYGFPVYGDMSEAYWNPLTWLIASTVGYNPWSFTFEMIFYIFVACKGMYSLSGIWINNVSVRQLTAVIFACSGFFIGHLQHFNWITGAALLPFCVAYLIRCSQTGELKYYLAAVISWSWFLTAAHPGIIIGMILFMIPLLVHLNLIHRKAILRTAFTALSVLIVCAGMLYAYIEVLPFTNRSGDVGALVSPALSTGVRSWMSLIMSLPTTQADYIFENDVAMRNCFIGILTVASLTLIISAKQKGTAFFFLCLGLAFMFLSSELVLPVYKYIPLVNYVRLNSEFRIFAIFSFIIAGGISLEYAFRINDSPLIRPLQLFRILYVAAIATALAFIVLNGDPYISFLDGGSWRSGGIKSIINNLRFAETIVIHGLIQLIICSIFIVGMKRNKQRIIMGAAFSELIIAALLNLPFTGVGQRSVNDIDRLLSAAPRGVQAQEMKNEADIVKQYPDTKQVIGDWSLYSKQIAMESLFPYPLMFRSTEDFAESERKALTILKPPIFLASGATINPQAIRYSFQSITVNLESTSTDSLVIKQNNYPKWVAEMDGKTSTIHSAFGTFISVPVPAGQHDVVIRYRNNIILPLLVLEFILLLIAATALFITSKAHRIRYIFP